MSETKSKPTSRRAFLKNTGRLAAASALTAGIVPRMYAAESNAIRLALVGCGGRGTGAVADAFSTTGGPVKLHAVADLFEDQLQKAREHYTQKAKAKGQAGPDRLFKGPQAFRELANCPDVDVVLISSPDYFHPEHLDAVVQAGKHVYCEKPAAVDVAGCKRFMEIGKKVQGRFSMDVGFNVRHAAPFTTSSLIRPTKKVFAMWTIRPSCNVLMIPLKSSPSVLLLIMNRALLWWPITLKNVSSVL